MLKKDITYRDLDDNPITETFWFNMSRAELTAMAAGKEGKAGGFDNWIRAMVNAKDGEALIEAFEKILLATVGERSADNKSFLKTEEYRTHFRGSDAYSELFMELIGDEKKTAEFINGVLPAAMREEYAKALAADAAEASAPAQAPVLAKQVAPAPVAQEAPVDDRPEWMKDPNRVPTNEELRGATQEQMFEAFRRRTAAENS